MRVLRCIAIVLPIVMVAAGCGRKESTRVVGPPPPSEGPQIVEAHWVMERDALDGAVQLAASSPLVRRAIVGAGNVRLTPVFRYAVRAEGTEKGGARIGATILPYILDGDSTHAVFISLLERDGKQLVEAQELILGREPTALESGFSPLRLGDRIGWIKNGSSYALGVDGLPQLAPEKFNWVKFITCFLGGAEDACTAGSSVAQAIAPGYPYAAQIGCGVGVALHALGCAAGAF
ncbi:MAG: hypothetical protein E6K79_07450 [Candidatus Eisenbacteria bacterium]|uniref:Lipoprotein n=1 Tax=Eiseniibacteriota bacterium TaxID=2212470 RepID=A0A538TLM9_UNCEI|nr:MAG: hypothetical protein E6K79_07450 [Candidatus Eisenbacteria bacterium]